jgi:hypothetical protein
MNNPFSLICLLVFSTFGISCYEEKGLNLNPINEFSWFECPIIVGESPRVFLSHGSNNVTWDTGALVIITNMTDGIEYKLKSTFNNRYIFYNDSLQIQLNKTYQIYINTKGRIFKDSTTAFLINSKLSIDFKEFDPSSSIIEGKIISDYQDDIRYFNLGPRYPFYLPLWMEDFREIQSNTNIKFNYHCGKPIKSTSIRKTIFYSTNQVFRKLELLNHNKKGFDITSTLNPPTNYDEHILQNRIGGFFGFIGILHSNTLENLDNSEILKTLKLIEPINQTEVTDKLNDIYLTIVGGQNLNENTSVFDCPRRFATRNSNLITANEISQIDILSIENPYKCEILPKIPGLEYGVIIQCKMDGQYYAGFAKFKDLYAKEQIEIILKKS